MADQKPTIKKACAVSRANFFITSVLPLGAVLAAALYCEDTISWELVPAIFLGVIAIHWLANLTDEYFDFSRGVDLPDAEGFKHLLAEGCMKPEQVKTLMWVALSVVIACSIPVFLVRGWPVVIIILAGLAGAFFYTAPPIGYKYRGLGDLFIIIFMGPLLGIGGYLSFTGEYSLTPGLLTLPAGLLIASVLNANNIRDLKNDKAAGIITLPGIIGIFAASVLCGFTVSAPFIIISAMVIAGLLPFPVLFVLAVLPQAVSSLKILFRQDPLKMPWIDMKLVKLHIVFHLILTAALLFDFLWQRWLV